MILAKASATSPEPLGLSIAPYLVALVVVAVVAGYWNVFAKANRKGWECLVPGWNAYILAKIAHRPGWWAIGFLPCCFLLGAACWQVHVTRIHWWWLMVIPGLPLAVWLHCRLSFDLAKAFGRGHHFGLRLALYPMFYVPFLGFGYCEYRAKKRATNE